MAEDSVIEQKLKDYLTKHVKLLPTEAETTVERLKELADAEYRSKHNITGLTVSAYEGKPKFDDLLHLYYVEKEVPGMGGMDRETLSAFLLGSPVLKVYQEEGQVQLGFEYVHVKDATAVEGAGAVMYVLVDDIRKYRVEFMAKIPSFEGTEEQP